MRERKRERGAAKKETKKFPYVFLKLNSTLLMVLCAYDSRAEDEEEFKATRDTLLQTKGEKTRWREGRSKEGSKEGGQEGESESRKGRRKGGRKGRRREGKREERKC